MERLGKQNSIANDQFAMTNSQSTLRRSPSQPEPQKTAELAPIRTKSHQIAPKKFCALQKGASLGLSEGNASEAVKKLAESSKTQNAPVGNQRFAQVNFGRFQFFHSFSVTEGRDGSPSRPRVVLAGTVASARRPYLPARSFHAYLAGLAWSAYRNLLQEAWIRIKSG
jgi:hypothetical protein